ncbi:MAG: hypothetical protein OEZ37_02475, partial [Gemmatimonadota bacterium]|nr:hypothetical protein [Gemmatimonadota bacterium]
MRIFPLVVFIGFIGTYPVAAQEAVPSTMTLEDALRIARENSPAYLQSLNDAAVRDWEVREAR